MNGSTSNSKKFFIKNKKTASSIESSTASHFIKKYKSQDTYAVSTRHKENGNSAKLKAASPHMKITHPNPKEVTVKIEVSNNSRTSQSIPNGMRVTSSHKILNEDRREVPVYKKNISDLAKPSSKMNSYLSNRPKQGIKTNGTTKILNDDSIQELDTEENINSNDNVEEDPKDFDEMKTPQLNREAINGAENDIFNRNFKPLKNKFCEEEMTPNSKGNLPRSSTVKEMKHQKKLFGKIEHRHQVSSSVEKKEKKEIKSPRGQFLLSAKKGDKEAFLQCLEVILNEEKGNISIKDERGWNALHIACEEGNLKIVEILIKANIDVNARTNNKKTALHFASSHGYFDISKLLVQNGAIINSLDEEKNTPIHLCASSDHIELIKYLLDRFPQADIKNIYGKTPFDLANKDEVRELIAAYLNKKENQYHKVKIHTVNSKQVNTMLNNIIPASKISQYTNTCNINIADIPHAGTHPKSQPLSVHHGKLQSNDFHKKNYFNNLVNPIPLQFTGSKTKFQTHNIDHKNSNGDSSKKEISSKSKTPPNLNANSPGGVNISNSKQTRTNHLHPNSKINTVHVDNKYLTRHMRTPTGHYPLSSLEKLGKNVNNSKTKAIMSINPISREFGKKFATVPKRLSTPVSIKGKENGEKKRTEKRIEVASVEINLNDLDNKNKAAVALQSVGIAPIEAKSSKGDILPSTNTDENAKCESEENDLNFQSKVSVHHISNLQTQSNGEDNDNDNYNDNDNENEFDNDHSQSQSNMMEEEKISPSSFICHALIGKGSFGEVYLVEKINSKTLYAMKILSKDKIMAHNLVKYAMTERNVLSISNHPFIVKLNFAFQTTDKLFLILDYCPGGDLAEHLSHENRFSEDRAKFYLCEIILALEDLHKRDIIFRDLKPDNVVLDSDGHAMLTDFGLSREGVLDAKSAKSFCGSIAYLAPEMLKRNGHGKAVDWYLLGVLFYEMLVGIPPYFTDSKEQIFKNIEHGELKIPKFVSEGASTLLRALLQRDPTTRLGSGALDAEEVKSQEYFKNVNWKDVYNRKLCPPTIKVGNRALQHFSRPKVFSYDQNDCPYQEFHFDGWSFIQPEDKNS